MCIFVSCCGQVASDPQAYTITRRRRPSLHTSPVTQMDTKHDGEEDTKRDNSSGDDKVDMSKESGDGSVEDAQAMKAKNISDSKTNESTPFSSTCSQAEFELNDGFLIQKNILIEATHVFDYMKKMQKKIPQALQIMISIARSLTVGDVNASPRSKEFKTFEDDATGNKERNRTIFWATSCASLFLRLVCPAIISPIEWGALKKKPRPVDSKILERRLQSQESFKSSSSEYRRTLGDTNSSESSTRNLGIFSSPRDVKTTSFFENPSSSRDEDSDSADSYYVGAVIMMAHLVHMGSTIDVDILANSPLEIDNENKKEKKRKGSKYVEGLLNESDDMLRELISNVVESIGLDVVSLYITTEIEINHLLSFY